MKHSALKVMIATTAVVLISSLGTSSAQARTKDVVKYGAIGVGALAVSQYYNDNNGYYNNGYYNNGYYDSGYNGSACGGCSHRATTCCQPQSCGLFGLGFLGL